MTRSEKLEAAIALSKQFSQEPTPENGHTGNANQEMRELNAFVLDLLLAEQKRAAGCPVCRGEETVKDYFGSSCVRIQGNHLVVANAAEEYEWKSVVIKACPFCGRDLTEGESV